MRKHGPGLSSIKDVEAFFKRGAFQTHSFFDSNFSQLLGFESNFKLIFSQILGFLKTAFGEKRVNIPYELYSIYLIYDDFQKYLIYLFRPENQIFKFPHEFREPFVFTT